MEDESKTPDQTESAEPPKKRRGRPPQGGIPVTKRTKMGRPTDAEAAEMGKVYKKSHLRGKPKGSFAVPTETIIAALKRHNGLIYLAAKTIGCSTSTIKMRIRDVPEVAEILKECRGQLVDVAEDRLLAAIKRDEPWAIAMALKTLGKERGYVERSEHRHGGDDSAPPIQSDSTFSVKQLPLETREKILQHILSVERNGNDLQH